MLKKEKLLFAIADHPTPKFSSGGYRSRLIVEITKEKW